MSDPYDNVSCSNHESAFLYKHWDDDDDDDAGIELYTSWLWRCEMTVQ